MKERALQLVALAATKKDQVRKTLSAASDTLRVADQAKVAADERLAAAQAAAQAAATDALAAQSAVDAATARESAIDAAADKASDAVARYDAADDLDKTQRDDDPLAAARYRASADDLVAQAAAELADPGATPPAGDDATDATPTTTAPADTTATPDGRSGDPLPPLAGGMVEAPDASMQPVPVPNSPLLEPTKVEPPMAGAPAGDTPPVASPNDPIPAEG